MEGLVKGDVVVLPFPFSDLSEAKRRPALVLATLTTDDVVLCQITSQPVADSYAVELEAKHFETGSLNKPSKLRPNRLFTADKNIILYSAGHLKSEKTDEVIEAVRGILEGP